MILKPGVPEVNEPIFVSLFISLVEKGMGVKGRGGGDECNAVGVVGTAKFEREGERGGEFGSLLLLSILLFFFSLFCCGDLLLMGKSFSGKILFSVMHLFYSN